LSDELTSWSPAAKAAGVGIAAVAAVGLALVVRGAGKCSRLKRYHDYALRQGGREDLEAGDLRREGLHLGCDWARDVEASREQDRYLRARGIG
jgi:hypothetical protein